MNLTNNDLNNLREAFGACRVLGVDAVVITEGKIRGVSQDSKSAILADADLSFSPDLKIGIGRIPEFEKRLSIFSEAPTAEGKVNDNNDVVLFKMKGGKTSVEFRCTSPKLIRYPKSNADEPNCYVSMSKEEVQQLSRAIRSMGAETVTLAVSRTAAVKFECTSPTNEACEVGISEDAAFENDQQGAVHIYAAAKFASLVDAAIKSYDSIRLTIGNYGSLSTKINGYDVVMNAEADHEGDDDE